MAPTIAPPIRPATMLCSRCRTAEQVSPSTRRCGVNDALERPPPWSFGRFFHDGPGMWILAIRLQELLCALGKWGRMWLVTLQITKGTPEGPWSPPTCTCPAASSGSTTWRKDVATACCRRYRTPPSRLCRYSRRRRQRRCLRRSHNMLRPRLRSWR